MKKSTNKDRFKEDLVASVIEDFNLRRSERLKLEQSWQLNLNYYAGNQYCEIAPNGEIKEQEKYYLWQSRNVYNHIAPILDTRIARLERVRPHMSVRASGAEESDLKTAEISSKILNSTFERLNLKKLITNATVWSEITGTAFYKVTYSSLGGKLLGENDNGKVYEGDVVVDVISPFEIFPDSLCHSEISDCKSIIHARAMHVDDVFELYGVRLKGEDIDAFTLNTTNVSFGSVINSKKVSSTLHDHVLVIEKYERPSPNYKNGRIITVGGGELLQISELPYFNGENGERDFPFIKQCSLINCSGFFGSSIVERIIPLQRSYNAVKNRKHEFLNRASNGVLSVEDGSVDTDDLTDEGLSPGKVIVYRQGSRPPQLMPSANIPVDFSYEEERLFNEFINISGVSEISRTSLTPSTSMSGTAIELLIEQDETRLSQTIDSIKNAVRQIGKQVLRLFKQFATDQRIMRFADLSKKVNLFYFKSSDISSDDVVFDTENELAFTPAQKKNAVFEMLSTGLLTDSDGQINQRTKVKILEILGYGTLDNTQDISNLHKAKAEKENLEMANKIANVDLYDDHLIHVEEHTRYLLTIDNTSKNISGKQNIIDHLQEHKKFLLKTELIKGE